MEPQIEQQELRTIGDSPIKKALSSNGYPGPTTSRWPRFYRHFIYSPTLSGHYQTLSLLNRVLILYVVLLLIETQYVQELETPLLAFNLSTAIFLKLVHFKDNS